MANLAYNPRMDLLDKASLFRPVARAEREVAGSADGRPVSGRGGTVPRQVGFLLHHIKAYNISLIIILIFSI